MNLIHLAEDRDHWMALVNTVMDSQSLGSVAIDRGFICCITCVSELTRTLSKLEERIVKRERIIEEKGNEIEKLHKVIQNLEMVSNSEYFKIMFLWHCY
jgi:hypothetical protein